MKKLYFLFTFTAVLISAGLHAQMYQNTLETGSRFNPGLGTGGTPIIAFDDVNVASTLVGDADSLGFTRIRVGIRRLASAPAVTVNVYLTGLDPVSFGLDSLPVIPPRLIGTFNLPANGAIATTQILEIGDGTNFFAALPRDTGNLFTSLQTAFVGVSFSNANTGNGWRLTAGPDPNLDGAWFYNVDDLVDPRTIFGFGASAAATFYISASGGPKYASTANDVRVAAVTSPENITCFSGPQTIQVRIQNLGNNTVAPGAAAVTLRVRGANTFTGTLNNTNSLVTGAQETISFNNVDLSLPGLNLDTAFVTFAGDTRPSNDTGLSFSITASSISSYPAVENVEGNLPVVSYVDVVSGSQLWTIQDPAIDGAYINPDMADSLQPRTPGSKFFLFDSYSPPNSTGTITRLYSNCLTFAPQVPGNSCGTTLSFWMSHDTTFATFGFRDSLYVSVSNDGGLTWQRQLPGIARLPDEGGFEIPGWREEIFDLTAYAGQTIQIGFEGVSDWGNAIGLDDITINSTCVVPVRLTQFNAERFGKSNRVTWKTSQEINTAKFVVELSRDGRNFRPIGEVTAAGNSGTERSYSFIHQLPERGFNYYRLKMVDRDNSSKYSPVSKLQNLGNNSISTYPNPVSNQLNLAIEAETSGNANVLVTDLSGKVLLNKVYTVTGGASTVRVNTSSLSAGNYIIKVQLDDTVLVQKFTRL